MERLSTTPLPLIPPFGKGDIVPCSVHNSIFDQLLKNDTSNWHNKNSPIVIKCFVRPFLFLQGFDPHFTPFQGYDFGLLDNIYHIK